MKKIGSLSSKKKVGKSINKKIDQKSANQPRPTSADVYWWHSWGLCFVVCPSGGIWYWWEEFFTLVAV